MPFDAFSLPLMSMQAWITLAVLVFLLGTLAFSRLAADLVFGAALTMLLVTGVVSAEAALEGFSNPGVLTVGVLYVVVAGLRDTGGIQWISQRLLGRPRTMVGAQLRVMMPVTILSAFLNNTPVVAMMIPAIRDWSGKLGFAPSKLMIPLSYAAIFGGTCTLIGTSTNLVVNGLLIASGREGLGMFELAWIGLPTAIFGIVFVLATARFLLPNRNSAMSKLEDPREYSLEMLVETGGSVAGKSIEEAGLRHLGQLYLVEIDRDGVVLPAVSPQEVLQGGDRLVFVGVIDSVVELQRMQGLKPATDQVFKLAGDRSRRTLVEAVVSDSFPNLNRTIREGRFRNRYGAAVIAVARNGERLKQKIGDIRLQVGDTLLMEAQPDFHERQRNSRDFFLVSRIEGSHPLRFDRTILSLVILAAMVGSVAIELLSMLEASLAAAGLMLLTRCTRPGAARSSIDWPVLIVIASAFGVGNALEESGLADAAAGALESFGGRSPVVNLGLLYLTTALASAVITNNAAAALMFPIAVGMARDLGVDVVPFAIAIAMAASASFATPIGYQTNLMVYGPGGYRFHDYIKIGLPLTVAAGLLAVIIIPRVWGF